MNKKLLIAYTSSVLSMLIWSLSFIWAKIVFQYYHPITTVTLRLLISSIFLIIVMLIIKKIQKIKKEDIKWFLLLAFFEPLLYYTFEGYGLKRVSSTIGALVVSTIPVFTPFVAFMLFRERLSLTNKIGLILSFVGIVIMIVDKNLSFSASPVGVMLLFCAVASSVSYTMVLKNLSHKYSILNIVLWQNIFGFLFFLPLFFINDYSHFITVIPDFRLISNLIKLAVFASSVAFIFYAISVRDLGVSKTNLLINTIPVFTAFFSYFILSEVFTLNKILGIIIVLAGIFISELISGKK
ncbi:MAG: DMT family transporter [Bacteroidota bacterium]|nr:DMT family transporter [Bacteroidota bacterium]